MTQEALQCRFEEIGISDHGETLCDSSIPITSEHASECKTTSGAGGRRLRHEARCGLSSSTWPSVCSDTIAYIPIEKRRTNDPG